MELYLFEKVKCGDFMFGCYLKVVRPPNTSPILERLNENHGFTGKTVGNRNWLLKCILLFLMLLLLLLATVHSTFGASVPYTIEVNFIAISHLCLTLSSCITAECEMCWRTDTDGYTGIIDHYSCTSSR